MQNDTPNYPNWFDGQRYHFENHLLHLAGKPDLKFLQIGVFTGDASMWLLENILTDPSSSLTDVDTWQGSEEPQHKLIDFNSVYTIYLTRTSQYDNVLAIKSKSEYVLPNLNHTYDFIYIDGDHTAKAVAADAIGAWKLLKPNGILAFDDYLWGQDMPGHLTPRPAIDDFLAKHEGTYDLLTKDYQVWLKKK